MRTSWRTGDWREPAEPVVSGARDGGLAAILRSASLFATFACAAGSLWLMLRAGHNNGRILPLVILFAMWVLSPFLALVWAHGSSGKWPLGRRVALELTMPLVALGSLAVYAINAMHPISSRGAFVFLVVPAAGWALAAAVLGVAGLLTRRREPSPKRPG